MIDVVDADPKRVVADKEASFDAVGATKIHRKFWPEMAIEQIIGAVLERAIKAWKVETLQQRRALGVGPQPIDHLFGRHHQFEQRRKRSEGRRRGKECVSTCRSRWSPSH